MKYATANTMKSRVWKNGDVSPADLEMMLSQTTRTNETIGEYLKMSRAEQSEIKDKGGFVGGHLAKGQRHRESVLCRSMLTLDMDYAETDTLESVIKKLPFLCLWHTTHKHTPEHPRYRLVMPLAREVTKEEYPALGHMVAKEIGIDLFDDTTYEAHRLMHWPTTAKDGEFLCGKVEGPMLDPDNYLAKYDDWHDATTWPLSSRKTTVERHGAEKAQDPLQKRGIVGAFCRTYTVQDAIREFIPDVYEPTESDDRWTYAKGEGSAGLVIYGGKFAYSHHGSDPCCERLLNAFDLVRMHRFRDLDADTVEGSAPQSLPSYKAMAELASEDGKVGQTILDERRAEAIADFSVVPEEDASWKMKLKREPRSKVMINCIQNLSLILANDPNLKNFAFNELAGRIQVTGPVPWSRPEGNSFWRDADACQLTAYVDAFYGEFTKRNYEICLSNVVENRRFHPVRDYLDGLPEWDGEKRVEDLFIRYLRADDSDYVRQATRKAFAAAVKRVYEPGCKADSIIVLDGPQGIGKSTIVRDLVTPEFYSESLTLTDMEDKTGAEKLQGFWVVEIGELAGMKKADIERVKAFISTQDDKYRPSYGRAVESHPRSCVMIATVNGEHGYLRDITGNRRFWVLKLRKTERVKNWSFDENYRAQFWAEAKALWRSGETLFLEGNAAEAAETAQREAMERDDRAGMVEDYLEMLLPGNWWEMSLAERREYIDDDGSLMHPAGTMRRDAVCNAEIWSECFAKDPRDMKAADCRGIGLIMSQIEGWERTGASRRIPPYGKQRVYMRNARNDFQPSRNDDCPDIPF